MNRKIVYIIVAVLLVAGGLMVVKNKKKEIADLPKPAPQPMAVQTAKAEKGDLEIISRQIAEIQPFTKADIAPRITGNILSFVKREGDSAEKGEIIFTIDDRELADRASAIQSEVLSNRQKLAGAKSVYETQRSVTGRDEKLYTAGAISLEALERSRSALESAKASMNAFDESVKGIEKSAAAAKLQSEYAKIRAPFSGIITKRLAEPGDLAAPGKIVLVMEQKEPVRIIVQVPQELMKSLGKDSKVYLSDGKENLSASVTKVYPSLGKNLMGSAEIVMQKSPFGLSTGSTLTADLVLSTSSGIIIPENALIHSDKGFFVCLVENGDTIKVKQVEYLGSGRGESAIKADLPEGAVLATGQENRLMTLTDGKKVTIGGKK